MGREKREEEGRLDRETFIGENNFQRADSG